MLMRIASKAVLVATVFMVTLLLMGCPLKKLKKCPVVTIVNLQPATLIGNVQETFINETGMAGRREATATQPVSGAKVWIYSAALNDTSDNNGDFSINQVPPGTYWVEVYTDWNDDGIPEQSYLVQVTFVSGQTYDLGVLFLQNAGSISGTVTRNGSAVDVAGTLVYIPGTGRAAVTDNIGHYQLAGVPPGTHRVVASYPGFASAQVTGVVVDTDTDTSGVDMNLAATAPPGTLNGNVKITSATDFSGSTITVVNLSSGNVATTSTNGDYSLINLPAGLYRVVISHSGYVTQIFDGIPILSGQATTLNAILVGELTPPEADSSISGHAFLQGQTDHTGIFVWIEGTALFTFTDAAGDYSFPSVPPGDYDLAFVKSDYIPQELFDLTVVTGTPATATDVTLIQNQAPVATITEPANNQLYHYDEGLGLFYSAGFTTSDKITYAGSATDAEDGAIPGSSLSWVSSLDGFSGTGSSVQFLANQGTHTLTLTATDSYGKTGSTSINFTVDRLPQPSITVPANGASVAADVPFTLTGTALDFEDGTLTGAALVWTDDVEGSLGTGSSLTPTFSTWGSHTITLTATDSVNGSKSTSITIDVAGVLVEDPNGGETVPAGVPYTLQWDSSGVTNLKIEESRDDGANWSTIVASTSAAAGSFAWTPAPGPSTQCLIRLTDTANANVTDESDNQFTIPGAIAALGNSTAAWGDFDKDGDLDLVIAGSTTTGTFTGMTKLYENDGTGGLTEVTGTGFQPVYNADLCWADLNNDGFIDLILSGTAPGDVPETHLYQNNGDGTFTDQGNGGLPDIQKGTIRAADENHDGLLDVALMGDNGSNLVADVLLGNGDFTFFGLGINITPVEGTLDWMDIDNSPTLGVVVTGTPNGIWDDSLAVRFYWDTGDGWGAQDITSDHLTGQGLTLGDFNNDGLIDFAVSGYDDSSNEIARVYLNDGSWNFNDVNAGLTGAGEGSIACGDFNNDGFMDVVVMGKSNNAQNTAQTILYNGDGNGNFVDSGEVLTGATFGCVAPADWDLDTDLDLVLMGLNPAGMPFTELVENTEGTTNLPPLEPISLFASTFFDQVTIFWGSNSDDHTPTNSLSYNVRVGTTPGGDDILSAHADTTNGFRRIVGGGNAGMTNSLDLRNLPDGTYFYSVQGIDGSWEGGAWAFENSFTINNNN